MTKVSVVIPVYGQWHLLKRNIDSLLYYDRHLIEEILVVDDCSPDANPYLFDEAYVRMLRNAKNLGYTGTVNHGLRRAACNIIVLLDSDAYPTGPFVEKLIGMYDSDPSTGCIGFGTFNENGIDTGNYELEPSVGEYIIGQQLASKLGFLRFWRNRNKLPYSCAVSFTRECLEDLDFFDEKIFPVLDADNDISMRIHRSAWKLLFTKGIMICHSGGNSYKVNSKRVMLFHDSRWKLLRKYRMITFPAATKALLKTRIIIECLVFRFLSVVKGGERYHEKRRGRQMLIHQINRYQ